MMNLKLQSEYEDWVIIFGQVNEEGKLDGMVKGIKQLGNTFEARFSNGQVDGLII